MKNKHYLLAMAIAVVAVAGLFLPFSKRTPAYAVPTKVYDVSQATVIGEVDAAAGNCKYLTSGKLICPGYPNANVQFCLENAMADAACAEDATCILDATQSCVTALGNVTVLSGVGGVAQIHLWVPIPSSIDATTDKTVFITRDVGETYLNAQCAGTAGNYFPVQTLVAINPGGGGASRIKGNIVDQVVAPGTRLSNLLDLGTCMNDDSVIYHHFRGDVQ